MKKVSKPLKTPYFELASWPTLGTFWKKNKEKWILKILLQGDNKINISRVSL